MTIPPEKDHFKLHLMDLPYFRALIRSVEASYYQDLQLDRPILDLGCGDGHFASLTFEQKVDFGLDPSHGPIHEAGRRDSHRMLVEADAGESPFSDAAFGSAFSNSVLEHITHINEVLEETFRVLKPGALFAFCVPNPAYFSSLSLTKVLGKPYENWFRRISRVEHADDPSVWEERLKQAGFELEHFWHYFPPAAMRMLEWGHYFGLPSWIIHTVTGKWVLVKNNWNLYLTDKLIRPFSGNQPVQDGTFTFYLARKPIG
ncbi:methyltransferase domain-containing protein [Chloroflexota bacterium]